MLHARPPEEFYAALEKRLRIFKVEPTAQNVAVHMWLSTSPELDFTRKLQGHPDPERVTRVMLELCDLLYANQGMRAWYSDLDRHLFYAELEARPEEPEHSGTIIHDEGPEPDWVEYPEEGN